MAKFLKGNELNLEIERIFDDAQSQIILISPYIKLHDRYKSSLLTKLNDPNIRITVLFGKNEDDLSKSMKQDDLDFFMQFPNIEILHEKRLHAKYYANESKALLTSMNLYGFSQNNNIEVGVVMEKTLRGSFNGLNDLDTESWSYFNIVLEQAELLFDKKPVFEKKNILSAKKYINSEIETNRLSEFFGAKPYKKVLKKEGKIQKPTSQKNIGYCIRTGEEISFNIEKPFSTSAYNSWKKFENEEYPEKYCHYSGEKSNGDTSFARPILSKYWKEAQRKYS